MFTEIVCEYQEKCKYYKSTVCNSQTNLDMCAHRKAMAIFHDKKEREKFK